MVNIGLMLPNSGMISRFGRSYRLALELGLGEQVDKVNFSLETGRANAGPVAVRGALEKLINTHDPDLVIAPLSTAVLADVVDLMESEEMPLLVSSLGEHRPGEYNNAQYVRTFSYSLWESAWLTGYRAIKDYGPSVAMVSAFHDCGYGFAEAVRLGAEAAGGSVINNVVTRESRASGARQTRAQSFDNVFDVAADSIILNYSVNSIGYLHEALMQSEHELPPMQALAMTVDEPSISTDMTLLRGMVSYMPEGQSRSAAELNSFRKAFSKLNRGRQPSVYCLIAYQIGSLLASVVADEARLRELEGGRSIFDISPDLFALNTPKAYERRVLDISKQGVCVNVPEELEEAPRQLIDHLASNHHKDSELVGGWFNPYLIV